MKNIFISGSNRGIGLGLTNFFAANSQNTVIGGIRNLEKNASVFVNRSNIDTVYFDLLNKNTLINPIKTIKNHSSKFDIIINNAGINIDSQKGIDPKARARFTLDTNLIGIIRFVDVLIENDALANDSIILNVSSMIANLVLIKNKNIRQRISEISSVSEIETLANEYVESLGKSDIWIGSSYPWPSYVFSKILLSIYTEILAKNEYILKKRIQVYSMCPGWVRTDLGGPTAPLSVEESIQKFKHIFDIQNMDLSIRENFLKMESLFP